MMSKSINKSNKTEMSFKLPGISFTIKNTTKEVHVNITKAVYAERNPNQLIADVLNLNKSMYDLYADKHNIKEVVNSWVTEEIKDLENRLEKLKFLDKVARRKNIICVDARRDIKGNTV
jgi:hypothetical protein